MKIKTADLQGPVLDWAVATVNLKSIGVRVDALGMTVWVAQDHHGKGVFYSPSTDWSQGGPIIEREKIGLDHYPDGGHRDGGEWAALTNEGRVESFGPTPLIAAMRCYVAYKLGDEVDVPEELCAPQT